MKKYIVTFLIFAGIILIICIQLINKKNNNSDNFDKVNNSDSAKKIYVEEPKNPKGVEANCLPSDQCDLDKIKKITGFNVEKLPYKNKTILKISEAKSDLPSKAFLMFPGTGGTACNMALKAQPLIQQALKNNFSVFVFQGECPYCNRRQFSLEKEKNSDLDMVGDVIELAKKQGIEIFYAWGFSEGGAFSLLVNDTFSVSKVIDDSGPHPSQQDNALEKNCYPKAFNDIPLSIKNNAEIFLICGEIDPFCKHLQNMYNRIKDASNAKILVIEKDDPATSQVDERKHTVHLSREIIDEIFN